MAAQRGNQGMVAGLLACGFGVLGILTYGIVFVPLAALCCLVGFINGLRGSGSGLAISALGGFLTVVGFIVSPSLWAVVSAMILASQPQASTPIPANVSRPAISTTGPQLVTAQNEAKKAMAECRAKRLSGILKTFEASAICSSDRIMQAFSDAGYKHMDLIAEFTGKRIAISRMVDQQKLTEAQGQEQLNKVLAGLVEIERQRDSAKN